jgi:DNA-binding NarL/FixJ family response regulator
MAHRIDLQEADTAPADATRIVLIADDDEFFRLALKSILVGTLGFSQVIETGSLDEALERMGENAGISLALFDLSMPGMESAASLGAVRECFPATRVAVVSGSQRRRDILLALEAGVHGYVHKGVGAPELARALRTIMDGHIHVPASLADIPPIPEESRSGMFAPAGSSDASSAVSLTPRQREVLQLLVQGKSNKEIARTLTLGEGTVKIHLASLFRNLGVSNRSAAAVAGLHLLARETKGHALSGGRSGFGS